ncbi:hypothetical protein ACT7C7_29540 [Bacillus cereus]
MSSLDKDIFIGSLLTLMKKQRKFNLVFILSNKTEKVYKRRGDWVMMFQEGLTHVAKLNFKGEALRVCGILLCQS